MPRPLRGKFVVLGQQLPALYLCTKFEKLALTVCEILRALRNFDIGSRHPGHAHLGDNLQSVNQNCPHSVSMRYLKSVALSATKIWYIFLLRTNWPRDLDLWPFDLKSGVRVTCDVGYLCANFSLPKLLCSRLRPDVRDRQTDVRLIDVRRASSLNASALWVKGKVFHTPTGVQAGCSSTFLRPWARRW